MFHVNPLPSKTVVCCSCNWRLKGEGDAGVEPLR